MISAPHPPATPACRQAWSVTAHSAPWLVGLCLLILPAARPAHAQPTEQAPPAADMPRTTRPASDRPSSGTREAPVLPPVTVSGRREALDEAPPAYPGGQVGSETWTVRPGLPMRAISKACRIAPVPPTVDSMAVPEAGAMPGYDHEVIMASGSFTQGSSIELSCDAPMKEPYTAYLQGGLNFAAARAAVLAAAMSAF